MKRFLPERKGFSLIEVVIALGLVTFVLVTLIGFFSVGLNGTRDSEQSIGAANLAAEMINKRLATPDAAIGLALPALVNISATTPTWQTVSDPVGAGGYVTNERSGTYKLTYAYWKAPNNGLTGKEQIKMHLILSSPYDAPLSNAATRYEMQASYLP